MVLTTQEVERRLLMAAPETVVSVGLVRIRVHAYGFEAVTGCDGEWLFGDRLARHRAATFAAAAAIEAAPQ